jgi:hypothetical protein
MSVARQLAQAILGLALLGHVARLLAAAVNDNKPDVDPDQTPAGTADPSPTWVRDQRGGGVLPGGDVGGDAQLDESFSVRFHHRHHPGALVTYRYNPATDREVGVYVDDPASLYVERRTEYMVCTDPTDPGGTEEWPDYDYAYEAVQRGFASVEAATAAGKQTAEAHLACDEAWSGLPPWEDEGDRRDLVMWTAIWTLLAFVLLLFHGDGILAFAAEQLHQRRAHRLALERERTRQALNGHQRDALVWNQLDSPGQPQDAPADHG